MEKLSLEQVKEHNISIEKNKTGKFKANDVRTTVEENIDSFAKQVVETRMGLSKDEKGKSLKAQDVNIDEASYAVFGCNFNKLLTILGVDTKKMSAADVASHFGAKSFSKASLMNTLENKISFGSTNGVASTTDIPSIDRFIIQEIFSAAIRIGYEGVAMHGRWIAGTEPMAHRSLVMPRIERGDAMPSRVNEGAKIPVGSLSFGRKDVKVFKVGTGFIITDELLTESSINMMNQYLYEVGGEMAIGGDVEAIRVLVNGEQADNSESAPSVGVITTSTFAYKDIKRVFTRMKRLGNAANIIITNEDDGIDITGIDRFEGFNGDTKLANIRSIIGVPDQFDIDSHVLPANKIMFLSPQRAMVKLVHKSMTFERQRNPQTQTEEMYVSDFIGFAIVRRDARVLLDKSVAFSSQGFPSYMDIDARIAQGFKQY